MLPLVDTHGQVTYHNCLGSQMGIPSKFVLKFTCLTLNTSFWRWDFFDAIRDGILQVKSST